MCNFVTKGKSRKKICSKKMGKYNSSNLLLFQFSQQIRQPISGSKLKACSCCTNIFPQTLMSIFWGKKAGSLAVGRVSQFKLVAGSQLVKSFDKAHFSFFFVRHSLFQYTSLRAKMIMLLSKRYLELLIRRKKSHFLMSDIAQTTRNGYCINQAVLI